MRVMVSDMIWSGAPIHEVDGELAEGEVSGKARDDCETVATLQRCVRDQAAVGRSNHLLGRDSFGDMSVRFDRDLFDTMTEPEFIEAR